MAGNNALTAAGQYQDLRLESPGFHGFLLGLVTGSDSRPGTRHSTLDGGQLSAPQVGGRE